MENFADRYRGVAFLTLFLGTLLLAVGIILPFLPALLWAVMLSILMFPLYRRLNASFESGRWSKKAAGTLASSITTFLTFIIICVPFVIVGIFLYLQVSSLIGQLATTNTEGAHGLDQVVQQFDQRLGPLANKLGIHDLKLSDYVSQHSSEILKTLQSPLSHAP